MPIFYPPPEPAAQPVEDEEWRTAVPAADELPVPDEYTPPWYTLAFWTRPSNKESV